MSFFSAARSRVGGLRQSGGLRTQFADFVRAARRSIAMTPMQQVLRKLKRRGVRVEDLVALELFGGTGRIHTVDYANQVSSLEVWEINAKAEPLLKRNLPNARVKITNVYEEIGKTEGKYSLIVVDNPTSTFSEDCEHFALFPRVLGLATDSACLVVNVIPRLGRLARFLYPHLFNDDHLRHRERFYRTASPESIPVEAMIETYRRLVGDRGFALRGWFVVRRTSFLHYLVLQIERGTPTGSRGR